MSRESLSVVRFHHKLPQFNFLMRLPTNRFSFDFLLCPNETWPYAEKVSVLQMLQMWIQFANLMLSRLRIPFLSVLEFSEQAQELLKWIQFEHTRFKFVFQLQLVSSYQDFHFLFKFSTLAKLWKDSATSFAKLFIICTSLVAWMNDWCWNFFWYVFILSMKTFSALIAGVLASCQRSKKPFKSV